jgi:hypothetical protein
MNTPTGILEVNGIILTQEAIWQLEYLQSNGFDSDPGKKFDNSGILEKEKEITEVIFYITGIIANGSLGDDFSKEIRLLKIMYFMRDFYLAFKVPDDLSEFSSATKS